MSKLAVTHNGNKSGGDHHSAASDVSQKPLHSYIPNITDDFDANERDDCNPDELNQQIANSRTRVSGREVCPYGTTVNYDLQFIHFLLCACIRWPS